MTRIVGASPRGGHVAGDGRATGQGGGPRPWGQRLPGADAASSTPAWSQTAPRPSLTGPPAPPDTTAQPMGDPASRTLSPPRQDISDIKLQQEQVPSHQGPPASGQWSAQVAKLLPGRQRPSPSAWQPRIAQRRPGRCREAYSATSSLAATWGTPVGTGLRLLGAVPGKQSRLPGSGHAAAAGSCLGLALSPPCPSLLPPTGAPEELPEAAPHPGPPSAPGPGPGVQGLLSTAMPVSGNWPV